MLRKERKRCDFSSAQNAERKGVSARENARDGVGISRIPAHVMQGKVLGVCAAAPKLVGIPCMEGLGSECANSAHKAQERPPIAHGRALRPVSELLTTRSSHLLTSVPAAGV